MADPVGAARHVRSSLTADGIWMVVEPFAGESLAANQTPVGRVYYNASTIDLHTGRPIGEGGRRSRSAGK